MVSGLSGQGFRDISRETTDSAQLRKYYEVADDLKIRKLIAPTTQAGNVEKYRLLLASALDSQLYNALKAPALALTTNRQKLANTASAYQLTTDRMSSQFPEGATDAQNLAASITDLVIPSVTGVIDFYKDFANRQMSALSSEPTKPSLDNLARERAEAAAEGASKAQNAQYVVLEFKNNSDLAHNRIRRTQQNELQQEYNWKRIELAGKRGKVAQYDWVDVRFAFPPGGASRSSDTAHYRGGFPASDIANLENQMSHISWAAWQMAAVRGIEDSCVLTISSLSQSWAEIMQGTGDLNAYLKLISDVPSTAGALAENAKQTWQNLNGNLGQW
ncbi:hypothetical protein BOTBODRAFT_173575 [Botryobasidium botryosum FD-172 SS1]|uniref:Uncharacterized protein n=1 Tax=Botryobasidium botryosum (strain FD-172 SS1) TaxID=930990 RepID=A0A067MMH6_BOTB1|nr:hypothetical protein BOTBODRAFT_173575 [Botryobasidium botryosum FD-172 SS1]